MCLSEQGRSCSNDGGKDHRKRVSLKLKQKIMQFWHQSDDLWRQSDSDLSALLVLLVSVLVPVYY